VRTGASGERAAPRHPATATRRLKRASVDLERPAQGGEVSVETARGHRRPIWIGERKGPARAGVVGVYLWASERWRVTALDEPSGLPVIVILEPREHFAGPSDLPDDLAREQGAMLGRVERAVLAVDGIARVHIGRWGEGAEHLHWWFIGRPQGFGQLRSSFAEIWDEVLPPTPADVWQGNLDRVREALEAGGRD
jgi:diadenosine tetraphosphate (Ap4A) HIT family hydrolase